MYGTVCDNDCQNVQELWRCGVPLGARFLLHRASQRRNLRGGGRGANAPPILLGGSQNC